MVRIRGLAAAGVIAVLTASLMASPRLATDEVDDVAYTPPSTPQFTDVPLALTFSTEIAWLAQRGVSTGYDNGNGTSSFAPSAPVLREQMAAFLYRLAGSPDVPDLPTTSPFTDVATSHIFYPAIVWLARTQISTGYDNGNGTSSFAPSAPVLREQMAAFVHRFEKRRSNAEPPVTLPEDSPFTDVADSHVFYSQIVWLSDSGITTGYDEPGGTKTFRGSAAVLREQMAAFMYRYTNAGGRIELVGLAPGGVQPVPAHIGGSALSADGRYVAFSSSASNLTPGDSNIHADVFVYDRITGVTELISGAGGVAVGGKEPSISADGRHVAFASAASNLVPNDTNGIDDVFVHDRHSGTTKRVSVNPVTFTQGDGPSTAPSLSANGRVVAFASRASTFGPSGTLSKVFVVNMDTGLFVHASAVPSGQLEQSNGASTEPALSADGQHVAFTSTASNLVPGGSLAEQEVFVRHLGAGFGLELVALKPDGTPSTSASWGPSISADGRYVAFAAEERLEPRPGVQPPRWEAVYIRDLQASTDSAHLVGSDKMDPYRDHQYFLTEYPSMSADGNWVLYRAYSITGASTLELYDRSAATTRTVTLRLDGAPTYPTTSGAPWSLSADGRFASFASADAGLVPRDTNDTTDFFVFDRTVPDPAPVG